MRGWGRPGSPGRGWPGPWLRGWWWCGANACRWPVRCRCCRSLPRWVRWPAWTRGGCWRRRWRRGRGLCAERGAGCCRRWRLAGGGMAAEEGGEGWGGEGVLAGVGELLEAVAGTAQSGGGLVVEDVHWADSATLDFLTYLARPGRRGVVRVVVTCRSDEAPLEPQVARWLAQVRGAAGMEEITLGPLSRAEVAGQAAALAGCPVPPVVVDELFARAEGNPFFTEQLVAAALAGGAAERGWDVPAGVAGGLAEVLSGRAARCAGNARVVLNAMAVAGRPLGEDLLGDVTGLEPTVVRRGLSELAAARLLADTIAGAAYRLRHVLLAEAVAGRLLPGERTVLHERTA